MMQVTKVALRFTVCIVACGGGSCNRRCWLRVIHILHIICIADVPNNA